MQADASRTIGKLFIDNDVLIKKSTVLSTNSYTCSDILVPNLISYFCYLSIGIGLICHHFSSGNIDLILAYLYRIDP